MKPRESRRRQAPAAENLDGLRGYADQLSADLKLRGLPVRKKGR